METTFTSTIEIDGFDVEVDVLASGQLDPRDPAVGINCDGIAYVDVEVTDADGRTIELSRHDLRRVEDEAVERLLEEID